MDIAEVSMGVSQIQVMNSIGTAVLAESLELVEQSGQGLLEMMDKAAMEQSVNPNLGTNIDVTV